MFGDHPEVAVGPPDDADTEAATSAPYDPLLAERLGAPSEPKDIYLEEASSYRPISTGDIFGGIRVAGSTDEEASHGLAMLVAHPSAMRKGAALEPRARAAPVAPVKNLSRTKWSKGHFNVFPLPLLCPVAKKNGFNIDDRGWAALLEVSAPVETAGLDVRERIACLSPTGIHLLLQKLVHADTRYPVKEDMLARVFAPKLEEIEMLQTWNEELVEPRVADGADLATELAQAAQEFEVVFGETGEFRSISLRSMLEDGRRAGEAQRLLAAEIRSRRNHESPWTATA